MTAQTILPANTLSGGYEVANSYRSNSGDSPKLSKTFSSASNSNTTFTVSAWVKRSKLGANQDVVSAFRSSDGLQTDLIRFGSGDDLEFYAHTTNSSGNADIQTNRLFRDVGAWYHIVVRVDTTQGTDTNRVRIYVNGVQETSFSTSNYMSQNGTIIWGLGSGIEHTIGAVGTSNYFGGYVAEVVYLDSQSVAPTTFGEFDEDSGIWKPIDVSGLTFGNNSFYLDFENSAELGTDASGNSHTFTENNIAATDQSTDTCTNNFCTLNALTARGSSGNTLAEGNLQYSAVAGAGDSSVFGTIGIPPGMKVYFEVKLVQNTAQNSIGIHDLYDGGDGAYVSGGSEAGTYSFKPRGAASVTQYFNNGSSTNHSVNNAANDTILGVAIDNENGQIHYSLDGTFINNSDPTDNNPVALVTGFGGATEQYIHASLDTSGGTEPINQFNFGSPPYVESGGNSDANGHGNFNQAVPSGYFALNTKNLAEHG